MHNTKPSFSKKHPRSLDILDEVVPDSEEERAVKRHRRGIQGGVLSLKVGEEWAREFRSLNRGKTCLDGQVSLQVQDNPQFQQLTTHLLQMLKHLSMRLEALEDCSPVMTAEFLQVSSI